METKEFFKGKKDWERKRKGTKEKISKIKKNKKKFKREKIVKIKKRTKTFKKLNMETKELFKRKERQGKKENGGNEKYFKIKKERKNLKKEKNYN